MKNLNKIIWPIVIVLLSLSGIFIYEQGKSQNLKVIERVKVADQNFKTIVVQVDGAVKNPGVYQVTENIYLYEFLLFVEPLPDADLQKFNLAELLKDGSRYRIPSMKKITSKPEKAITKTQENKIININKADINELSSIPGIGISYAERIIALREEKGYFKEINDLLKVKGIGEAKLKAMKKYITLD